MAVTYEVLVDWDMTDWAADPDFSEDIDDISNDVQTVGWHRGKETEEGNAPAATFEIRMKPGLVSKYSMFNAAGPLYGKILPWRIIQVQGTNDGGANYYPVFFGFISKYIINPHPDVQSVYIYCTDGTDLLARQLLNQDYNTREEMTDGEAASLILDSAGWSTTRRNISSAGTVKYPNTGEY
jgi:hypothetical protein